MKNKLLILTILIIALLVLFCACDGEGVGKVEITTPKSGEVDVTDDGTKLEPGIYVQQGQYSGGGIAQVGYSAYRLNADGTFDYTDYYDYNPVIWSGHGTWSQNGSTVTFVWQGNPMVPAGYTVTVPVKSSTSFGTSGADLFKKT